MAFFLLMPREPKNGLWADSEYEDILGVYADTETEARELCAEAFPGGTEDRSPWLDSDRSICRKAHLLGPAPEGYKGVHFLSRERKAK